MWLANQRGVGTALFPVSCLSAYDPIRLFSTMRGAYFVPWTSRDELKQVFNWLYSDVNDSPDLVQLGLDRVRATCAFDLCIVTRRVGCSRFRPGRAEAGCPTRSGARLHLCKLS